MSGRTRVLFIIASLASGGAERQLCELVQNMDHARFEVHVVVFYDPVESKEGTFWHLLEGRTEIGLHSLHKARGMAGFLMAIPRLFRLMLQIRPHILHGYADGNALALLAGRLFGTKVIWGIRRTSSDNSKLDARSLRLRRWFIRGSRLVDLIIFNSEAGRANHLAMGMTPRDATVVPNGFDVSRFSVDPAAGGAQREVWGIPGNAPLIGISGRLHPVKDHPTFLRAAARILTLHPEAWFVCVGHGADPYTRELQALAGELGLADRVRWAGRVVDMRAAYNALSVLVLSSTDEGFPNVIGEAMACGVPCVSTRVGDAAVLVEDTGFIVEVGDDEGLARGVGQLLGESPEQRRARSEAARNRIGQRFSVQALAAHTQDALEGVLAGRPAARS
ncbi:MAG: glycosyltransferase [Acidobacteria bacterium]|nr:glycosyltransferase [Acidobacteriota bacterium]